MQSESEAQAFRRAAVALNLQARVERSYQHGTGWEYRVWVDDLGSIGSAEVAAIRLAEKTGLGVAVFQEGEEGHLSLPPRIPELPSSSEVRKRMIRALGGEEGAHGVLARAEALDFVFTRTLGQQNAEVRHRFSRAKGRAALSVEVDVDDAGHILFGGSAPYAGWTRGSPRHVSGPNGFPNALQFSGREWLQLGDAGVKIEGNWTLDCWVQVDGEMLRGMDNEGVLVESLDVIALVSVHRQGQRVELGGASWSASGSSTSPSA